MTRGVPESDGPKYMRDSPPRSYKSYVDTDIAISNFCISKEDYKEAKEDAERLLRKQETNKEFILRHKEVILTRGKYKGQSYEKAIENPAYISYCRENAKHNELKNLILYYDKVQEEAKKIYDNL